jgi:hypothetical protein
MCPGAMKSGKDLQVDHLYDGSDSDHSESDAEMCPAFPEFVKAPATPAPPPPPPPPPPSPPPHAREAGVASAGPRLCREFSWGPFKIAPVVSGGTQIGWGARCMRHKNRDDGAECKLQMRYRGRARNTVPFSNEEYVRQLKRWLLAGLRIASDLPNCRSLHKDTVDARTVGAQSNPEDLDVEPRVP